MSLRSFYSLPIYRCRIHLFYRGRKQLFSSAGFTNLESKRLTSISLTDRAIGRLIELKSANDAKFLRVAVEGGGCSGFQYLFNLDTIVTEDDCVIEKQGAKVVIDQQSLQYLEGATIDYHTELIRSAFRVLTNPKAESGCSCGSSFSLKV